MDMGMKRCSQLGYQVVEKKRKMEDDDEKGVRQVSDLKVSPPSSSLNRCSNEPVKKLFISFDSDFTDPTVYWYRIDPGISSRNNSQGGSTLLPPVCTVPYPEIHRCNGSVALGSKIFMMGGITRGDDFRGLKFEGSSDVFSFDTTKNGNDDDDANYFQWRKENTQLLAKRCNSALVATQGKIYVFGSNYLNPQPWAEVFDPELNTCTSLPHPPQEATDHDDPFLSAVAANGDDIFLSQDIGLFCFNVKNQLWSQISTPLHIPRRWSNRAPIVDDLMFTYSMGNVFAYDFAEQKWFERPVEGLGIVSRSVIPVSQLFRGSVVHLGNGTFLVLWRDCCEELMKILNKFAFVV